MLARTRMARAGALALAAVALAAWPTVAGEYHYQTTLLCYDCHTMHFSQTHNYNGTTPVPTTGAPDGNWLGATGPNTYLLKTGGNLTNLCFSCHDGQTFAPDVRGANTNSYVRSAGAIPTGAAPYENWKGHTLNQNLPVPGGFGNLRLSCNSCHAVHGNAAYRNVGNGTMTYALGTNNLTRPVFLRSFAVGSIATNYAESNVDYNEPSPIASAMSDFCRGCHFLFHGRQGDSNMGGTGGVAWLRHPTGDSNIGAAGGGHSSVATLAAHPYRVKVMSPSGDWGTQGLPWATPPANLTPMCLTCHKAHGNQNPFALVYLEGTGPITEEGDATGQTAGIKSLCKQCHVQ